MRARVPWTRTWWALLLTVPAICLGRGPTSPSPAEVFGPLYDAVQEAQVFEDSKTFADAVPLQPPGVILERYRQERPREIAELRRFVADHFSLPGQPRTAVLAPLATLQEHIVALWPLLTREPAAPPAHSSLLFVPRPYVVPGGRFREFYYWDSYFTMLGLMRDGHADTARAMLDDFDYLIRLYGHVPNGNRSYYLSRSQPPFFYLMVELVAQGDATLEARYQSSLRREYAFWMQGAATLRPGAAHRRVVRMPDGTVLNRYWDDKATPRDESYREDVALAAASARPASELYRDLRAAAESGWDFSSRWLADGRTLGQIRTTALVPADLNSLMYGLERHIATVCERARDLACSRQFTRAARHRAASMSTYLWSEHEGRFADFDFRHGERTPFGSAATVYPLFTGLATPAQAARVADYVHRTLLQSGGLSATAAHTGQQWDAPNGWPPLQFLAIQALDGYGERPLADEIARRWLNTVRRVYGESGKLLEKYDVEQIRPGGGGEYPLQDGFGWTNGVTRALLERELHH